MITAFVSAPYLLGITIYTEQTSNTVDTILN